MARTPLSLPSPDGEYSEGEVLGSKYELLTPIGEGGMGVVWIARDRTLDVDVAVKISRRLPDDACEAMTQRAVSEARLAAQLAHPAICRVLDFGLSSSGDPFVVSELLHGEAMDEVLLREGRLPPVVAVQMLLPVLDGLAAAHHKGIVHRDVKPANMFLARDTEGRVQPKLLDFGVARFVNARHRITTPGTVCGTASYMSPEQARGSSEIDARSDLWSFCASLYELVTGSPPFDGENYNAVLWAVLTTEPRPLTAFLAGDAALSAIVMRGLSRDPAQRFGSVQELGHELARWLLHQGSESDICGHSLRERAAQGSGPRATRTAPGPRSRSKLAAATPHALSATLPSSRARFVPRRSGQLAASIVAGVMLLGGAAFAFRSGRVRTEPEPLPLPAARAVSPEPHPEAAPVVATVTTPQQASPPAARAPSPPKARLRAAPRASESAKRDAESPPASESRPAASASAPPSPAPRKTNAMGFEFGF